MLKNVKVNKRKDHIIFGIILFRISLDFLYVNLLSEYYTKDILLSRGVFSLEVNIFKYVFSWFIFIIALIFIKRYILVTKDKASEIIILGLFIMSFIPSVSLFGLANLEYGYILYFILFWSILLISTYLFCNVKQRNLVLGNKRKLSDDTKYQIWLGLVFIFCLFAVVLSWQYNGLRLNLSLSLEDIYKLRLDARKANMGTVVTYLRNNAMYIVLPFAGIYFFQRKNWFLLVLLMYFQILLYSIDTQKTALFILPLSLAAYVFYKKHYINSITIILVLLNVATYLEYILGKSSFLIDSLLIRLYYLPAILSNLYYDYFTNRPSAVPLAGLFEKLGFIIDYPYSDGVPYILGGTYFNNNEISANTGLFGSAYSYGLLGLILIPAIYAIFFKLIDKVTSGLKINTYISILIIQVYVITGATIFVVLTVYGLILAIFMLMLINNNSWFQFKNIERKKSKNVV